MIGRGEIAGAGIVNIQHADEGRRLRKIIGKFVAHAKLQAHISVSPAGRTATLAPKAAGECGFIRQAATCHFGAGAAPGAAGRAAGGAAGGGARGPTTDSWG